jgi:adenosylcobinamide-GDP ribazoletransferase
MLPFLLAVQFLTRVPVPTHRWGQLPDIQIHLQKSLVWFPVVGGLIGAFTAGVYLLAVQLWPIYIAILLAIAAEAVLTGGFHEDAVADFCDAFGGGWSREDILRILKDSRVGSFGSLGLLLAVALRYAGMLETSLQAVVVWVFAGSVARWSILWLMLLTPPVAERESLVKDIASQLPTKLFAIGSLLHVMIVLPLFFLGLPVKALLAYPVILLLGVGFNTYLKRRIGGITGDCLGFACYASQIIALLVAGAVWRS